MISLVPTKGLVMPEAMVEIITLGSPSGKLRIIAAARSVPSDPPIPMIPLKPIFRCSSWAHRIDPSVMTSRHLASWLSARTSAIVFPAAAAISAGVISAELSAEPRTLGSR